MPLLGRSAQLVVNGLGNAAPGAEWVNVANVIVQGFGAFSYDNGATPSFAVQNAGAYHFTQDIAIPGSDFTEVDAGHRVVDYTAAAAITSLASTATMYLKALDGGGATLFTWSQAVGVAGKPYTPLTVNKALIPALTRTLRIGCQGNNGGGNSGWFDNMQLWMDDAVMEATKVMGYAVLGALPDIMASPKTMGYAVAGPGATQQQATKVIAYAVLEEIGFLPPQVY